MLLAGDCMHYFGFLNLCLVTGRLSSSSIDSMSLCLRIAQLLLERIDLLLHRVHPLLQATHVSPQPILLGKHDVAVLTATMVTGQAIAVG